ncbi:MAG: LPS export ABC transporter ATP-binding protein [Candidatus Lambdaproteobacteria bacterium RIFOXYD1_FULL_56_27]|uniref:LPS export ABC transporter ATP-binding protein n=1 Tax=Candidatus Lambdaproteobacteria bacterium RIFOXYD2_FULL_56_26 TaxID=1817773 RepID=A0A1F6H429_9PROT|nr:MAG: LPS export ABC transporter ATP-binding protein [Candidatus Lambdaproteobacteria bacterium RIFOXYC1_FULL_56_13]OGH05127.1 MAG: LPS export ABC transporter ATP-binding protein [Candidatus Lambdaproteobacteria bacterium RIFOXYD2_FULL_56_26]OGH09591.1 MAG: LPS export ABC transporter ATP-binding protein [Candidatus Lambdaproteobacteria bacterium RIFOXYD1_FULL_56_27]
MLLETRDLIKTYGKRTVVKGVSFSIKQGEVVGLLGANGAGKTTSFYMVVGVVRPSSGQIFLDNQEITGLAMYKRARLGLGYLPQEASVFRKLTVEQNLMAILETLGLTKGEQQKKADQILDDLHIQHIRKNKGFSLSGGERRRVEIARALVTDPKFMLLDEPFAGVDPIAVIDIQGVIKDLLARNIGILITDHNVRETLGIVDRAYIMNDGLILVDGTPAEIIQNETAKKVYLGEHFTL